MKDFALCSHVTTIDRGVDWNRLEQREAPYDPDEWPRRIVHKRCTREATHGDCCWQHDPDYIRMSALLRNVKRELKYQEQLDVLRRYSEAIAEQERRERPTKLPAPNPH